jgi:hypothetical protein
MTAILLGEAIMQDLAYKSVKILHFCYLYNFEIGKTIVFDKKVCKKRSVNGA